jgi:hypothetical protein
MTLNRISFGITPIANRVILGFRYGRRLFSAHVAKLVMRRGRKQEVVDRSKEFHHSATIPASF